MAETPIEQRYPAWRYHATLAACIVQNEKEDKALGKGWVDSPHKVKAPPPDTPPAEEAEAVPESESEPVANGEEAVRPPSWRARRKARE